MAVTIRKRYGGQNILNNTEINIGAKAGGLNLYAEDGTLLIQGDQNGFTAQDADGTRRSRFGTQPDGSREVANVTTRPEVDLVEES